MKILHLMFSEQVDGAEKHLLSLLPGLREEGVDCELICVTPENARYKFAGYCKEMQQKGVKTTLISGNKYNLLQMAWRIGRYLKKNNILILHSHLFKSDILAVMIKKIFYKKIFLISTKHGYHEKYLSNYHLHHGRIKYSLYYYISRYLGHNFDENVTVSRAMSDLYFTLKLTPQRIQYIHLGMDLTLPFAKENYGDFKMTTPQLIIVGRIEKIKGHQYLFDAMPDIMEVFPDVKLLILGNGAEKEQLVNQAAALGIENNISFLGYQQNPYDHIVQSDIIVLPSLFEPFGLVYIEAFALKTPVVAFDVPASNELITNNETGILVPVYDSRVMAEKIIYLLQNPLERKRLAENGFNKYTDYYLTSRMISETTSWYSTILKNMK